MYAIYKVNKEKDTSLQRTLGSLESQTLVFLATTRLGAVEFMIDTDLMTEQDAEELTFGYCEYVEDGKYIYYLTKVY